MPRPVITCVQPLCGRVTHDFYRVDARVAFAQLEVEAGPTCSQCYEDIIRRQTREQIMPYYRGSTPQTAGEQ